jgi:hypothetical protein
MDNVSCPQVVTVEPALGIIANLHRKYRCSFFELRVELSQLPTLGSVNRVDLWRISFNT